MPPSVNLSVEYDRSVPIRESVDDVQFTLLLAVCLVILVIFLFLRNISATIMPSLALPMAIMGTFAVMYMLGYTIDTMSLLALTLSVGFVVDDAIVMLENIVRHMEMGKRPLVSGLVSLTLAPMLSTRYLRSDHDRPHGRMYRALESVLDAALRRYGATLRWALEHRPLVMAFGVLVLVGTAWEFWAIPKGFLLFRPCASCSSWSLARFHFDHGGTTLFDRA